MLLLAILLAAQGDLTAWLRHLDSAAQASSPAPMHDASRVAFLTTLCGTRQAASMATDGGYPNQLTDEPGGALAVRTVPSDAGQILVLVNREGRRRILLLDDSGAAGTGIDPAPGDQFIGGFARDSKRLFYAVADGSKVALKVYVFETKKTVEIEPPPPAAGVPVKAGSMPVSEALAGLFALGPPAPDGRSIVASVQKGQAEALVLVDLNAARAEWLTDVPARYRQPRFAPDGKTLYVLTDAGRKTMGVDAITVQDKKRKTVYAPAQDLEAFAITEDGHRLATAAQANGETLFSLLELPSLRPQPLAAPPSGALAPVFPGESPLTWDRQGDRLFFGWSQADDTTDVWELRMGYGAPVRLTRSPRPGLPREAIARPAPLRIGDHQSWLWRPADTPRPRVAVLVSSAGTRPVFDKRIAALNFAGLAVLAVNGPGAQEAALKYLESAPDLDKREPLLLDFDGLPVDAPGKWGSVVMGKGHPKAGLTLDPEQPDLRALVKYARRSDAL